MTAVTVPVPPTTQALLDAQSSALLLQLVNATPAQVEAYMAANASTFAQVQNILSVLALGLRYVYVQAQAK